MMAAKLHPFNLSTLRFLDEGKAFEAFAHHVRRAALDCEDRPGEPKPRKIVLEVALVPVRDEKTGQCEEVKSQLRVTSTTPRHATRAYSFALRRGGMLVFNENSPGAVNQATIFDDEDEPADTAAE